MSAKRDWRSSQREMRFQRRQVSAQLLVQHARAGAGLSPDGREGFAAPLRPASCRHAAGASVGVVADSLGSPATFSGLIHCGSVWACPVCSASIRQGRADEVTTASKWWERREGGAFLFATFTLRHRLDDSLEQNLDALTQAFRSLIMGAPWKRFAARHGIRHQIKAVEVTRGENGWHPHLHVLWFVERALSDVQRREARAWLSARWRRFVVKHGGRLPSDERGVDLRDVQHGNVVSLYLAKLQEHDRARSFKIGNEMARLDLKKGRLDSLTPFELLDFDGLDEDEREERARLWVEWVETTRGRRALTWSRGLKAAAGIEDVDDQELADDEPGDEVDVTSVAIRRRDWKRVQNDPAKLCRILELAEAGRWERISQVVPCSATRCGPESARAEAA
ncbi:protein rep [Pseudoclavibacter sp. 13-3]|uniref:protein rep n=1 Tax=Pseudoclavibacter sp. 13-3 TaxID=2901228 RepID=UPI001E3BB102|nr:protein rep [Pseudoclavibacter sp. 13-3]MCD7101731.1 protein rep [Pseudoclavibacter sp. 13-3]